VVPLSTGMGIVLCHPFWAMSRKTYTASKDIQKIIDDLRREKVLPEVKALESLEDTTLTKLKEIAPGFELRAVLRKARLHGRKEPNLTSFSKKFIKEREGTAAPGQGFFPNIP